MKIKVLVFLKGGYIFSIKIYFQHKSICWVTKIYGLIDCREILIDRHVIAFVEQLVVRSFLEKVFWPAFGS